MRKQQQLPLVHAMRSPEMPGSGQRPGLTLTHTHSCKHACGGDAESESGLFCDLIAVQSEFPFGCRIKVQFVTETIAKLTDDDFWPPLVVSTCAERKNKRLEMF